MKNYENFKKAFISKIDSACYDALLEAQETFDIMPASSNPCIKMRYDEAVDTLATACMDLLIDSLNQSKRDKTK